MQMHAVASEDQNLAEVAADLGTRLTRSNEAHTGLFACVPGRRSRWCPILAVYEDESR
jgi:hypothetical protein